jgi:hypothetical protein
MARTAQRRKVEKNFIKSSLKNDGATVKRFKQLSLNVCLGWNLDNMSKTGKLIVNRSEPVSIPLLNR